MPRLALIAVPVPGTDGYTYRVPDDWPATGEGALAVGDAVLAPLGPRRVRAIVVDLSDGPAPEGMKLRDLAARIVGVRISPAVLDLARWAARYYRCGLGSFLAGTIPGAVLDPRRLPVTRLYLPAPPPAEDAAAPAKKLTAKQQAVLSTLAQAVATDAPQGLTAADLSARAGVGAAVVKGLAEAGRLRPIDITAGVRTHAMRAAAERHPLTDEQAAAVAAIAATLSAPPGTPAPTFVLRGVTGSGKTLVYQDLIERVIAAGRQVLMLVPEIGLTPQLAGRLAARFPRLAVWHSSSTPAERSATWQAVSAGRIDVVLGCRSALFVPLPAPGLIVVDEEHDGSFKQDSTPRYHARDLAVLLGKKLGIPVVLGSATPSLETIDNVRRGRYRELTLTRRPAGAVMPEAILVDMRAECKAAGRNVMISRTLIRRAAVALEHGEQVIVLLNRRGWAPVVTCASCGHKIGCRSCDITLVLHKHDATLKCHACGHEEPLPRTCPNCGERSLGSDGVGTEQLAAEVARVLPGARVLRLDADTVRSAERRAAALAEFAAHRADVLVGTQMVAKGLDFPLVTVVGVLQPEAVLAVPEFRSAERAFQLVAQVAGRAGRADRPGCVVVQAFEPHTTALAAAATGRFDAFWTEELSGRERFAYPPFVALVRVLWRGESLAAVTGHAGTHGTAMGVLAAQPPFANAVTILGPSPCGLAWLQGRHRWHLLIKASDRATAQRFLDAATDAGHLDGTNAVEVIIDVDPQSLM